MKTKQFKLGYFIFLILSVLLVSFNGCDKDDDNDDIDDINNFLELYVGTTWKLDDAGGVPDEEGVPTYFRVIIDSNKILESWYQVTLEPECYSYNDRINVDGGVISILENSQNKIVIRIAYGNNESETFTCTIQGDIFKIVYVYEEVGFPDEQYTMFFNKTTVDVDSLTLCPL